MAILTRNEVLDGKLRKRRIYFAHIPKSAGSSLYIAFLDADWQIQNVRLMPKAGLGPKVFKRFSISEFQIIGDASKLGRRSIQHAPYSVWQHWGPFEESFAIVRNPRTRYLSALRYQYFGRTRGKIEFEVFRANTLALLKRGVHARRRHFDGHFAPQSDFVGPDTHIFKLEDGFTASLAERYGIDATRFPRVNKARDFEITLTTEELDFIGRAYAQDMTRFGYGS
ncbi:hypothetical protein [Yoonia litorea]|uniref:Sulfotransferase family protein n=1 Tax=Yoonia litorea TaxID=1123755 RepID=A0A1I6LW81_9RHOB|nr:hypothetical protein [Yoonia litorea]SFS07683.1 hypothetical protein SAMN05444714_0954 [Yoonia litorea]